MNAKRSQPDSGAPLAPARTRAFVFGALMATAVAVVAQQTNLPPGLDFSSFKIIADRDIFNQSRLPHERAARAVRVADSFSLVGTLFYAGGDIAFFDGTSDEYRQALKVGGQIAGFKVTAVTLDSVTLSDGTNETNLKITAQMRRDDSGRWSLSAERASYAGTGSATSLAAGAYSGRSRRYGSSRNNFPMMTGSQAGNEEVDDSSASGAGAPPPPAMEDTSAAAPAGGADDALARLMQRRAQEEQQLRQGQ